jgi:hypothetical protein
MNEIHTAFRRGAVVLAEGQSYSAIHREMGLLETDWSLLTQDEHWTPAQSRQIRSILANVVEVALTIAGMPAVPLPGQYVAAVIAIVVAPANRLVACQKVPETFDAVSASGLHADFEIRPMKPEQMMALVIAYSGGLGGEPAVGRLAPDVVELVKKESAK